jgi:hypothetical protein
MRLTDLNIPINFGRPDTGPWPVAHICGAMIKGADGGDIAVLSTGRSGFLHCSSADVRFGTLRRGRQKSAPGHRVILTVGLHVRSTPMSGHCREPVPCLEGAETCYPHEV